MSSNNEGPRDVEAFAEVLAAHVRGDWSDRTYACQGCSQRLEREAQATFDAIDGGPTVDQVRNFRSEYAKVSHPDWTLADYHAHLAEALLASPALAALVARERAEAWDEGKWATYSAEREGRDGSELINPYRADQIATTTEENP